jgi:hypothetical protein
VLKANFGKDSGSAPAAAAVPEPSTALLASLAACRYFVRRRRA